MLNSGHFLKMFVVETCDIFVVGTSDRTLSAAPASVNVSTKGDLSSLKWIKSPVRYFRGEDNQSRDLCSVYYASLNFRDIMLATGKLPPDSIPGRDYKNWPDGAT